MRNVIHAALVASAMLGCCHAFAEELWDPHLRGVDEGLAAGALPPPGVYFVNNSYFLPDGYVGDSKSTSTKLQAYVNVPILLWTTGVRILGADFGVAIAQPFDYTNLNVGHVEVGNHWGTYNTVLMPAILSWKLPYDLHVKTQFAVYVDNGSSSASTKNSPSAGVGAAMANWTFEPGLGISWLHDGWNVSAQMLYETNTADNNSSKAFNGGKYQSGDQLAFDYTITKTIGKWVVGVGAYENNQLQRDNLCVSATNCGGQPGTATLSFAVGPIVGYNFGPIELMAIFNHQTVNHNDVGGDTFNLRTVIPLY
ncbi:MAG: transporter [Telmatospirillum sp.]|nr:transporter [Telmatospirillum sp.]